MVADYGLVDAAFLLVAMALYLGTLVFVARVD
jgi:hypothetical protein